MNEASKVSERQAEIIYHEFRFSLDSSLARERTEMHFQSQELNNSDAARIEWCVSTLESVKGIGRNEPLGDKWQEVVMVIDALKRVLQRNLQSTDDALVLLKNDKEA